MSNQREGFRGLESDRGEYDETWRSEAVEHVDRDPRGGEAGTDEGAGEEVMDANRFLAVLVRDLGA